MNQPIHVAIDARPLSRGSSGIRRYLECLLDDLINEDQFRFSLYSDGKLSNSYQQGKASVNVKIVPEPCRFNKLLWQYHVNTWLKADRPNLYFSPRHHLPLFMSNTIPAIVTIHDVIWKSHPKTMRTNGLYNEKLKMPHAIRRADHIICPSQATARNVSAYWPNASEKISVIAHGMTEFSQQATKPAITKPYYLAVGTIEPRKNYPRLIRAFDQWASTNHSHDLVIIGNKAWGWSQVSGALENCSNRQRIHHLEGVNDAQLAGYYQQAAGFIQLSLEEGFGMPVAEARQFGLSQILSDLPVFRELDPDCVIWIDPLSLSSIENSFNKMLKLDPCKADTLLRPWSAISKQMTALFKQHAQ